MKKFLKLIALSLVLGTSLTPTFALENTGNIQDTKQKSELQLQCEAQDQACNQKAEEIAENRYLGCYYALVHPADCDLMKEKIETYLKEQCAQQYEECFPGIGPVAKEPN